MAEKSESTARIILDTVIFEQTFTSRRQTDSFMRATNESRYALTDPHKLIGKKFTITEVNNTGCVSGRFSQLVMEEIK